MLDEAAGTTRSGAMLRELYIIILRFCVPSNPRQLFDDHWIDWKDDFQARAGWRDLANLSEAQIHQVVLQNPKPFNFEPLLVASKGAPRPRAATSIL